MTNPVLGFGQQPAGISAAGLGTPLGLPTPGTTYESVADLTPARSLDLATLDYAVDTSVTGAPHGVWDPTEQQVVLRLTTRRGRLPFSLPFGNDFFNLDRVPADVQSFARIAAENALRDMIEAGIVRVDSVEALAVAGNAVEAVTWTDLEKNQERTTLTR